MKGTLCTQKKGWMALKTVGFEKKFRGFQGFTLLEILLAVFIFGITMTTLFGSFNAIFGNIAHMEGRSTGYDTLKTCLDRINEDLASFYVTPLELYPLYHSGNDVTRPDLHRVLGEIVSSGERTFSKLRFSSYAHLPFENDTRKGVAQVVYYVQFEEGRYRLKRGDKLYPYGPLEEYPFDKSNPDPVLCNDVQSFSIVYYDGDGKEFESWNSDADEYGHATPKSIGIKLVFGEPENTLTGGIIVSLPVFRQGKTP
jgi:general secretion pathway protein J